MIRSADVIRILSSSVLLWSFCTPSRPSSPSGWKNTMIGATATPASLSATTTTASSRLFVTKRGGRGRRKGIAGSRIDLRVIGNPSAVNLGKLVSTSFPRDLLLLPPGTARKGIFASTVFTRHSGKFNLTLKRPRGDLCPHLNGRL